MKAIIYTDGGARGNPGPAAAGVVIFDDHKKLISLEGKYLGKATNNEAEYQALIIALDAAHKLGIAIAKCYLDSELIVKQLNGEYKVKSPKMISKKAKVDELVKNFSQLDFIHIRRKYNKFADKLVNIALDARD